MIRLAVVEDLPVLQDIERAAGEPFRALGMAAIADDDPPSLADLAAYQNDGRAWVCDDGGGPVAYLLAEVVDGHGHIEQVSVHPDHARQGLGRRLIEHAADWAARKGLAGLTLTTYAEVPWNAPYYSRLGFVTLGEQDLTEGLRAIRAQEIARGLNAWPRVTMRR
ncbi:GNAT family N-acetyltransferase [Amycolatopsis regifaucium]|uniref:Acetyltransferase n=1 Tax=Amycolatopsis regifaucium TaxID=546365 RepID=A0A154MHP7_9PSEU|nr:GNAT family N-acetyltransferase [Amycolatopsis regifaucium]KZB83951.1 acetyltransferase [Amycolatopsis regifaucium]OKA06608.1 GNAT family N-acetyltransferase [Amycolatopsis regifaucium]SFH21597.1 Predicted N-acetyltransferase YhbS [Amycolatopsis regifaucium]